MSNGNLAIRIEDEGTELQQQAMTLLESIGSIQVVDKPYFEVAGEKLKEFTGQEKAIKEYWKAPKAAAAAAHKEICNKENEMLSIVQKGIKILRDKVSQYLTAQELKRQEEERKARMAAEEAARKERERLEAQALKAMEKGKDEKAEQLIEQAEQVFAAPVVIPKSVEQTTKLDNGGTISQKKDIEVTLPANPEDTRALCAAIAKGAVPVTVVTFSKSQLKTWAKMNLITGKHHGCIFKETVSAMVR